MATIGLPAYPISYRLLLRILSEHEFKRKCPGTKLGFITLCHQRNEYFRSTHLECNLGRWKLKLPTTVTWCSRQHWLLPLIDHVPYAYQTGAETGQTTFALSQDVSSHMGQTVVFFRLRAYNLQILFLFALEWDDSIGGFWKSTTQTCYCASSSFGNYRTPVNCPPIRYWPLWFNVGNKKARLIYQENLGWKNWSSKGLRKSVSCKTTVFYAWVNGRRTESLPRWMLWRTGIPVHWAQAR